MELSSRLHLDSCFPLKCFPTLCGWQSERECLSRWSWLYWSLVSRVGVTCPVWAEMCVFSPATWYCLFRNAICHRVGVYILVCACATTLTLAVVRRCRIDVTCARGGAIMCTHCPYDVSAGVKGVKLGQNNYLPRGAELGKGIKCCHSMYSKWNHKWYYFSFVQHQDHRALHLKSVILYGI